MVKGMVIKNMPFKVGQKVTVVGVPDSKAKKFSVNIGASEQDTALHISARFKSGGDEETVVCNSHYGGTWGEEVRIKNFPFEMGEEFKIVVELNSTGFMVTMPDGFKFAFVNRPNINEYSCFRFEGDVRMQSLEVE